MKVYTNFYETCKEADMRLKDTIVLYDGKPYYVLCVTDHKDDGIYRVYLDELGTDRGTAMSRFYDIPSNWHGEEESTWIERGKAMDKFMDENSDSGILRKMANSPAFNRFKPFPLGFCNYQGSAHYIERSPKRYTQQGLMQDMLVTNLVELVLDNQSKFKDRPAFCGIEMYDTIMGNYPTAQECVDKLRDESVGNSGVGFARDFAFVKGPVMTIFLAWKTDIIGNLPCDDLNCLYLSKNFIYLREVLQELGVFNEITVR